jgi:hypothetical protein
MDVAVERLPASAPVKEEKKPETMEVRVPSILVLPRLASSLVLIHLSSYHTLAS